MTKLLRLIAILALLASPALAQAPGQFPAGTVLGNATGARALSAPTATPILGLPGTTLGTLRLSGNTSGTATIRPQAAAGTPTITLGTSSGTPAVTASSPLAITTATGNITCATCVTSSGGGAMTGTAPVAVSAGGAISITGAAGQVLAGATPAFTATPTLGIAGTTLGTLSLTGNTSGTVLITPQATAGSPTLTLPNASGTFAVSASAPLALSATTGNMTITGAAGQVLAGATPAFTATPTLGASGTLGSVTFGNATSGLVTLQPVTGALGTVTLSLPARTDTLVTLAGTEALTNKTYNGNTFTAGTGILTIAAAKTLTVSNSLTLAGTDATTMTFPSTNGTIATLNIASQVLTGGAIVTAPSAGSGSYTVNCGLGPLQTYTNGGAATWTAPANDGSCIVKVTNNGSASASQTFTGFTVSSNVGDAFTATNGHIFYVSVVRIGSTSNYVVRAAQ